MTNEEYMEMRYRLREEDEKQKKAALTELIAEMMEFRTMLSTHLDKKINDGLEDTKSSLVGSTNLSIVDNLEITDRIGTLTNLQTHDLQKANDSGNK